MKSDPAVPEKIHERLQELKDAHCEVVLFILNGVGEDIYKTVKYFGNHKLGIITQYVVVSRVLYLSQASDSSHSLSGVQISLPLPRISVNWTWYVHRCLLIIVTL